MMSRKNLVLKIYELSRNYVTIDKAVQEPGRLSSELPHSGTRLRDLYSDSDQPYEVDSNLPKFPGVKEPREPSSEEWISPSVLAQHHQGAGRTASLDSCDQGYIILYILL